MVAAVPTVLPVTLPFSGRLGSVMVSRPSGSNAFEFVVVSALRTHQLMSGCLPRVSGLHKPAVIAQLEVAGGHVAASVVEPAVAEPA